MTAVSFGSAAKPGTGLRSLFAHPAFRSLWIGALAMNLATLMQAAGGAWLMVSLTPSPLLVALMQTASTLPRRHPADDESDRRQLTWTPEDCNWFEDGAMDIRGRLVKPGMHCRCR